MDTIPSRARLLLVDDEEVNLLLLERILRKAGYQHVTSTSNPREAVSLFLLHGPDLVCTDLHMPALGGLEVIEQISSRVPPGEFLPIVVLTGDATARAEEEALARGAHDFLTKPFQPAQIRLRLANLLRTRQLQLELRRANERLEARVRERTRELDEARHDILERLAMAAEYRDQQTGRHTQRVGVLSGLLAQRIGMPGSAVELIRRAAPLHDLGKIAIPDTILLKPGPLSLKEFEVMKGHIEAGADLLAEGASEVIRMAELIALTHHERWDGSGYPRGLRGDDIPLPGQVVAVADVFDTLVNERPYKPAWPLAQAIAELRCQSGRAFAPRLVAAFCEIVDERPDLLSELASAAAAPSPAAG